MKKKEINSVSTSAHMETNEILSIVDGHLSKTPNKGLSLFQVANMSDANTIHTVANNGLTLYGCSTSTLNTFEQQPGVIIHIQRLMNNVSPSQSVSQLHMCKDGLFLRTGAGNGSSINFTAWKKL